MGGVASAWLVAVSGEPALAGLGWVTASLVTATGLLVLTTSLGIGRPRRSVVRRERSGSDRWEARPLGAFVVRALTFLGPVGAALATALAVQAALPEPGSGIALAGQAVLVLGVALAVVYPAEKAARRLAPIAMLLSLSLSFPSAAPSRFVVARRSAAPEQARRDLQARRGDGPADLLALVAALTAHDSRTRGHSERVRVFSEMLAEEMGLDSEERERLRWAALLHDVGKLSVPSKVLNKPARLDEEEWRTMYRHPEEGQRLITPMAAWLGDWARSVGEHHERYDGSGYPKGLREESISLGARIIAVADAFDTMVTPRSYRKAAPASAAREEVVRVSGSQFDPQVVRALLNVSIPKLWWRAGLGAWFGTLPLLRPRRSSSTASAGAAAALAVLTVGVAGVLGGGLSLDAPPSGGEAAAPAARAAAADAPSAEEAEQASETLPSPPGAGAVGSAGAANGGGAAVSSAAGGPATGAAGGAASGSGSSGPGSGGGSGPGGGSGGGGPAAGGGGGGDVGATSVGGGTSQEGGTVIEANEDAVFTDEPQPAPTTSPAPTPPGPPSDPPPSDPPPPAEGDQDGPPWGNAYGHDKNGKRG